MNESCNACGVPKALTKSHAWEEGCIVDRASGNANLFLYEAASMNSLIDEVGSLLGISVDDLVFKAAANAAEGVVGDAINAHPALFRLLKRWPLHRLAYEASAKLARAVGAGNITLLGQKGGQGKRRVRVRIENPFNVFLVSAMVVGAMRAIYNLPVLYDLGEEDGAYSMEARQAQGAVEEEAYERLAPSRLVPDKLEGEILPTCGRCGAPSALGDSFAWKLEDGLLVEKAGGERMVFPGLYLLHSLIREFDLELGGTTAEVFLEAERRLYKRKLARAQKGQDSMSDPLQESELRSHLALRGLGYLESLRREGGTTEIVVKNAFIAPLLAGRLVAMWEYDSGLDSTFDYSIDGGTLALSIKPS
ncbi:MAG: hypothetical protein HPY75_12260 [Actinobacteria bacterium]|nr:hypothetical protein [Actinomycetota bacterium]